MGESGGRSDDVSSDIGLSAGGGRTAGEPDVSGSLGLSAGLGGTIGKEAEEIPVAESASVGGPGTIAPDALSPPPAPAPPLAPAPLPDAAYPPPTPPPGPPVPRTREILVGGLIANRYEVVARLGEGGMGTVYRVRDRLRGGAEVALKAMQPGLLGRPKAVERFLREVEVSLRLSHENIVRVYDVGEDRERGIRFYTMELLEGISLRDFIEQRKKEGRATEPREAMRIVEQILEALRYAHRTTVHRDLKPENVMLAKDGTVKVLDFGIAKLRDQPQLTAEKAAIGTAYYMAPEQRADAGKADARADLYAASVILYELLTGELPVGRFRTPSEGGGPVPRELDEVVLKGLDAAPERRFGTADELLTELRAIRGLLEGAAAARPRSGATAAVLGAGGLVLAGVLAIALFSIGRNADPAGARGPVDPAAADHARAGTGPGRKEPAVPPREAPATAKPPAIAAPAPAPPPLPAARAPVQLWLEKTVPAIAADRVTIAGRASGDAGIVIARAYPGLTLGLVHPVAIPETVDGRLSTRFSAEVPLDPGENVIGVRATDRAGLADPADAEVTVIRARTLEPRAFEVEATGGPFEAATQHQRYTQAKADAERRATALEARILKEVYGRAAPPRAEPELIDARSLPDGRVTVVRRVSID